MFKKLFDLFKRSTSENDNHHEPCEEETIIPKTGEVWVLRDNKTYVVIYQYLEGWVFYKPRNCKDTVSAKKIDDFVYVYNKIPDGVAKLMIEKGIL